MSIHSLLHIGTFLFYFFNIGFYREISVNSTGKNDDHAQHWFFENYFNFCQSCVMRVRSEEWSALRMLTILNVFLINATWMLFNSKKILKSRRNPLITLNSVYSTNSSVDFNSWSWMVQWFLDRKKKRYFWYICYQFSTYCALSALFSSFYSKQIHTGVSKYAN